MTEPKRTPEEVLASIIAGIDTRAHDAEQAALGDQPPDLQSVEIKTQDPEDQDGP